MDQNSIIRHIIRLFILVFTQVFILSNIHFAGYISPVVYLLFLYYFPSHENKMLVLTLSFFTGLLLDILLDSLAFHTLALLIVTYLRTKLLRFVFGIAIEQKSFRIQENPWPQRVSYLAVLLLIHHTVFFIAEGFSFAHGGLILKKIVTTFIASLVINLLLISLFSKQKS